MHVDILLRVGDRAACGLETFLDLFRQVKTEIPVVGALTPGSYDQIHRGVAEVLNRNLQFRFGHDALV